MLNSEALIAAMSDIDERHIIEAGQKLGYTGKKGKSGRKKTLRVLLIAAAISVLFAATAAAAGWFGFSSRTTPVDEGPLGYEGGMYVTMTAYAGTPEAQANVEWQQFWFDYTFSHEVENFPDYRWLGDDEELKKSAQLYAAWDQTMVDKLLELRDKYGVRLHTDCVTPPDLDYFYSITGIEKDAFPLSDGYVCIKTIYEDGSFSAEGSLYHEDQEYSFSLNRGAKGVLDSSALYLKELETLEEWQYTTSRGELLNLAIRGWTDSTLQNGFIFYDGGDYLLTASVSLGFSGAGRAGLEYFAEQFNFTALCGGKTDVSRIIGTKPTTAKPKGELLTQIDWVETDEYKASSEFQKLYCDYASSLEEYKGTFVEGDPYFFYYGAFPTGIGSIDEAYNRILEEYALQPAGKAEVLWGRQKVPAEYLDHINAYRGFLVADGVDPMVFPSLTGEEIFAVLGCEDFFIGDDNLVFAIAYENGAFQCENNRIQVNYIPKGCFYPLIRYCLHPEMEGWAYDTACGEQVYIVQGGETVYPVSGYNTILYETDLAYVIALDTFGQSEPYYLEMLADSIDFTKFK